MIKIITESEGTVNWIVQGKQFSYRGFIGNWEISRFQLYTEEEWGYGEDYRVPEMSAGSMVSSLKAIDQYWDDMDDNDLYISDEDIEDQDMEYEDIDIKTNNDPNNLVNKKDDNQDINIDIDNNDDEEVTINKDRNLNNPTGSKELIF